MKFQTKQLLKFEGEVNKTTQKWLGMLGWVGAFLTWWFIAATGIINAKILPSPIDVLAAFPELLMGGSYEYKGIPDLFNQLVNSNHLLFHIGFSSTVNILGYIVAASVAIPLGFLIGLYPAPRHLLAQPLNAIRYLPIPAAIGVFIAAFGIGINVKVMFLATGILVYLLPVVVQRVVETEMVHKQTLATLGATAGQKLRHLYIPSVMSRVFVDIIVLVAIGWTYISVIEVVNNQGGLGGIAVAAARGRTDIIYAILVLIMGLGTLQDKLMRNWDRRMFKHKYA